MLSGVLTKSVAVSSLWNDGKPVGCESTLLNFASLGESSKSEERLWLPNNLSDDTLLKSGPCVISMERENGCPPLGKPSIFSEGAGKSIESGVLAPVVGEVAALDWSAWSPRLALASCLSFDSSAISESTELLASMLMVS